MLSICWFAADSVFGVELSFRFPEHMLIILLIFDEVRLLHVTISHSGLHGGSLLPQFERIVFDTFPCALGLLFFLPLFRRFKNTRAIQDTCVHVPLCINLARRHILTPFVRRHMHPCGAGREKFQIHQHVAFVPQSLIILYAGLDR